MIDTRDVIDTVVDHLTGVLRAGEGIRAHTAPPDRPPVYAVIEVPPGSGLDGDHANPEAHATVRVRVRSVARNDDVEVAGSAALDLDWRLRTRLLNRTVELTGTGWKVTGRRFVSTSGVDTAGPVANVATDIDLWAVPASEPG